jgi:ribonucleoside-diphosphate reductase beta chain
MSLFKSRTHYKPFDYEWAFEAYDTMQKMHWLPSEVPLHEDIRDWNERLTDEEKSLISSILKFFTQGDVDIAQAYLDRYIPKFKPPEVRMMLSSFANSEANHAHSYSLLNDTIGETQLTDYKAFQEYKEMSDKHTYLFKSKGTGTEGLIRDIACFSAFGEGLQLFASFVMLLNFQRFGRMKGMCQIVTWSIRDETHHVEGMKLFHQLVKENPEVWTEKFKAEIYQTAREMVDLEDKFIDLAFAKGGIRGLKSEDVKQYIRYIADRRLLQLSLKPNYKVKENPLSWLDWVINGVEHANFFESRATEYNKGTITGSLWG